MELLLFLIANSASDIRAIALSCIDLVFQQKTKFTIGSEKDIVSYLSTILITKPEAASTTAPRSQSFNAQSAPLGTAKESLDPLFEHTPPKQRRSMKFGFNSADSGDNFDVAPPMRRLRELTGSPPFDLDVGSDDEEVSPLQLGQRNQD